MSDLDAVLARLVNEPGFREELASDAETALADYQLEADDLRLLASQLGAVEGVTPSVEQRTSKAGLFGLLAQLADGGGGGGGLNDADMYEVKEVDSMPGPGDDADALMVKEVDSLPGPNDGSAQMGTIMEEQPNPMAAPSGPGDEVDALMVKEVDSIPIPDGDPGLANDAPGSDVDALMFREVEPAAANDAPGSDVDALMFREVDPQTPNPVEAGQGVAPGDEVMFNPQPDTPGGDPLHADFEIEALEQEQ